MGYIVFKKLPVRFLVATAVRVVNPPFNVARTRFLSNFEEFDVFLELNGPLSIQVSEEAKIRISLRVQLSQYPKW